MSRARTLQSLREDPRVSVLVIGGGINGIGSFRDLALQDVDCLLVERGDFGSGASAASSHMLHGGLRYLENAEFRLVNEALRERDLMLRNAPQHAKALRTTIPIFRWLSGTLNAPLQFLGWRERPGERGALVIKLGLWLYDRLIRGERALPSHDFRLKRAALATLPQLHPDIICTASYYDAWMPHPERICLDLLLDAEAANPRCRALNYVSAVGGDAHSVHLRDELTGETLPVQPTVVINAAGPWIDFVNQRLGIQQRFIGGTKGSHLVLDNPALLAAAGGGEIFFENEDGRIVLILPFFERVLIGTTDIRIDNPDDARVSEAEIDYLLDMVARVFPQVPLTRKQIVFQFAGVRPLPYSEGGATGRISRDHSIRSRHPARAGGYTLHSLVGGKWTTFRAFAEQAADLALKDLGRTRRIDTRHEPIGGGRDYPSDEATWLREAARRICIPTERMAILFARYGSAAATVAEHIAAGEDRPLRCCPKYSHREIDYLARNEKVARLDDLLLRRTLLAMLGYVDRAALCEVAAIAVAAQGWSSARRTEEIQRCLAILRDKHGARF
ncbi:MAG: glycerol-3-phosphate dehydrogenase/oxidase [Chloroflexi bacterium]|nr:glycerol-3-phosphate dehydrogenase/oxidase [Chloroflexota bacterium]MCY3582470.1 glycerol-3-phosphate dehydrogenase/oxidase [Chloroflexota bacterium]MCY3717375.1 glycerol-3-phosphate dehydrogenase/oxidase [Chloroflexota bacterium]MDE2651115.1 glycerol-3-phosphate dehydrogenase/oxidase [Chloroflexota bacterium]MXV93817.1 glycerol-3-phosphate dehydrogenase/oxidase [Chloroflexota bacterium]